MKIAVLYSKQTSLKRSATNLPWFTGHYLGPTFGNNYRVPAELLLWAADTLHILYILVEGDLTGILNTIRNRFIGLLELISISS